MSETAPDGGSNLSNLFQAAPETQPLIDIFNAVLKKQESSSELNMLPTLLNLLKNVIPADQQFPLLVANRLVNGWSDPKKPYAPFQQGEHTGRTWGIGIGIVLAIFFALLIVGLVSLFITTNNARGLWILLLSFLVGAIALCILGGWIGRWIGRVVGVVADLFDLVNNRIPKNYFGVCSGHTTTAESDDSNLTDWLSFIIDYIAGREKGVSPLTFGDLKKCGISLKMVTSNLSHGQPYILPDDLQNFLFKEDDMYKLFPRYVVKHMTHYPPAKPLVPITALPDLPEGERFCFFPDSDDLPAVVGARLSLSFPFLLSALPLYTISTQAYDSWLSDNLPEKRLHTPEQQVKMQPPQQPDIQLNWFSDGGICSNFPIQFFDAWLPSRPTFGINLTDKADTTSVLHPTSGHLPSNNTSAAENDSNDSNDSNDPDVFLSQAEDRQDPEWSAINKPLAFAQAIFGTSQNYHDNMQAGLPSYRERIAQVRLDDKEGGLNLTMPKEIIDTIVTKGVHAGTLFSDPHKFNFDHHRWVRFQVLMAQLEENLEHLQGVFAQNNQGGASSTTTTMLLPFAELLQEQMDPGNGYPYCRPEAWCTEASLRVANLQTLIKCWDDARKRWNNNPRFFRDNAPVPNPVLRVTPEV